MRKIMLLFAVSWIADAADFEETITVHLYNEAGARAAVITEGEKEASRIFRWARIAVLWANCPAVDPRQGSNQVCVESADSYTIVIANRFVKTPIKKIDLGFAMPFSGRAGISYSRLTLAANVNPGLVGYGSLLGAIMAHELAHLLSIGHGPGIMQADWTRAEFLCIGQRRFFFTPEQAAALRACLRSRYSSCGSKATGIQSNDGIAR